MTDSYQSPQIYRNPNSVPSTKFVPQSTSELRLIVRIAESLAIDRSELFSNQNVKKVFNWIEKNSSKLPYTSFASIMRLLVYDGNLEK